MIIVIIIIDTFILGGNNNVIADDPHLSNAVISIFVQNSMPPFVEFGHKILSQLNFGINVVDKWCLVSITFPLINEQFWCLPCPGHVTLLWKTVMKL